MRVSLPALTAKDLNDVELALELGVDFIALSFAREAKDIRQLRAVIERSRHKPLLIAKIDQVRNYFWMRYNARRGEAACVRGGGRGRRAVCFGRQSWGVRQARSGVAAGAKRTARRFGTQRPGAVQTAGGMPPPQLGFLAAATGGAVAVRLWPRLCPALWQSRKAG